MQVKGRTFKATFDFIKQKFSQEKIKTFFKEFPQFVHAQDYNEIDWYPVDIFISLSEKIDKFFGFGDDSLLSEMGAFSARQAFETSHKLFRNLTPKIFISNIQTVLFSYYSEGVSELKFIKDNKVKICVTKFIASPFLLKRIQGWLSQALHLSGAKEVSVFSIPHKKADMCFDIEWQ